MGGQGGGFSHRSTNTKPHTLPPLSLCRRFARSVVFGGALRGGAQHLDAKFKSVGSRVKLLGPKLGNQACRD